MSKDGFSKCHPVTNFVFFLGAICFGVVFQHPAYLLAALLCGGIYYVQLKGRKAFQSMGGMFLLLLAVGLINPVFNTQGETVLFHLMGRPYTLEALGYGFAVGGILVITLLWFGCYNQIMTEDKFTALFGNLAPSLSLLLVMIFRLIPSLLAKAKQITDARRSIGRGGQNVPLREKVKNAMTVLLSLTGWALESGVLTADSMRSRGYGTAKRSNFQSYAMTAGDWMLLAFTAITGGITLWGGFAGFTEATYTPLYSAAPVNFCLLVYCMYLLIPVVIHGKEVLLCRIFISKI